MLRKLLSLCLVLTLVGSLLVSTSRPVNALSGSDFNASRIIDDSVFFNSGLMTASQIQSFLNSKLPSCDTNGSAAYNGTTRGAYGASRGYPPPYTCLKDYSASTTAHPADAYCSNSMSGGTKSAAQIIMDVSLACGINPMVMLVTLEKEQSLLTDDWPWSVQYEKALGYACPDTAPCDPEYAGLSNQLYYAARQFQRYAKQPNMYNFRGGATSFVQYNPNGACGGSNITMYNQATAGLYNYTPYQPNSAALGNLYGSGDGCSAYGNRNFWRLFNEWFGSTYNQQTLISFKAHVGGIGWMDDNLNNGMMGTTGRSRSIEGFKINGNVEYSSYNYTTGWQPTVNRGMISGTVGQNKPIQAIKINPIVGLANGYDIYYRTHVGGVGWMDWAKNGQIAGSTGNSTRNIEAIEIRLVSKSTSAPGTTTTPYSNNGVASYTPQVALSVASHVSNVGWQPAVTEGMTSGTTEQSKAIEALTVDLTNNTGQSGGVVYAAHVSGIGWQTIRGENETAGTTGQSRQMEAFRLNLTGTIANNYDIWYRGHVGGKGWMDWAKNGQPVGSVGSGRRLEAIETRLVPKNSISLPKTTSLYNPTSQPTPSDYSLRYSVHVSNVGWVTNIGQDSIGGTTGRSKPLEAVKIDSGISMSGPITINCSAYVRDTGWTAYVSQTAVCGTTGQSKPIEGLRLSLTGDIAATYNIEYRAHVSNVGWQDWVRNNTIAGIPASNKSIEAIQVRLVKK